MNAHPMFAAVSIVFLAFAVSAIAHADEPSPDRNVSTFTPGKATTPAEAKASPRVAICDASMRVCAPMASLQAIPSHVKLPALAR